MARHRIRKATSYERAHYASIGRPLYPLYGTVEIDGRCCAVEDLRGEWTAPDPLYEIMAPKGFHFADDLTHSLLCTTLADVADRARFARLVPCTSDCRGAV